MTAPTQRPRPGGRSTVLGRGATSWPPPPPHPSGATPPRIPAALVPKHVAIVMDGNGRWAHARGLSRTEGHRAGEASLMDVLHGAIELGVSTVSAYAFSTENWRRSPEEVRFLMGFNKDVIRRRRDELAALGVRIRWAGRRPRLWRSVISQLEDAENHTRGNDRLTLQFCVNYGGRAEIVDAVRAISRDVQAGVINPAKIDERTIGAYLDEPGLPDVDLFIRTSGEQRTSNFLLWQSAYAELAFVDTPWPDFDRRHFWQACLEYAQRDRRFGGAGQVEPSGGAGSVEPSGGAGQVEPSGGAGQVEPSGGAGQVEPSGGAGSVEPSGGAGSVEPDALVVSPSSPQDGPA